MIWMPTTAPVVHNACSWIRSRTKQRKTSSRRLPQTPRGIWFNTIRTFWLILENALKKNNKTHGVQHLRQQKISPSFRHHRLFPGHLRLAELGYTRHCYIELKPLPETPQIDRLKIPHILLVVDSCMHRLILVSLGIPCPTSA